MDSILVYPSIIVNLIVKQRNKYEKGLRVPYMYANERWFLRFARRPPQSAQDEQVNVVNVVGGNVWGYKVNVVINLVVNDYLFIHKNIGVYDLINIRKRIHPTTPCIESSTFTCSSQALYGTLRPISKKQRSSKAFCGTLTCIHGFSVNPKAFLRWLKPYYYRAYSVPLLCPTGATPVPDHDDSCKCFIDSSL